MINTVALSGASGLIGSALGEALSRQGIIVRHLVRNAAQAGDRHIYWFPNEKSIDLQRLQDVDAVVHLGGEPIFGIWTRQKRERILTSRVQSTCFLSSILAEMSPPPKVLLVASATGYYGNRGDEILDEQSPPGDGFLATVCKEWEAAADSAVGAGIRCVHTRFGLVLTPQGGFLGKLGPIFRAGLGGRLGSGRSYMSWVTLDDLVRALIFLLHTDAAVGPFNVVAPEPVTNKEFTRSLASALNRPAFFAVPAPFLRLALGSMGDEMILGSARVVPKRLQEAHFQFKWPTIRSALAAFFDLENQPNADVR